MGTTAGTRIRSSIYWTAIGDGHGHEAGTDLFVQSRLHRDPAA